MNILIVDDEPLARVRLRSLLQDCAAQAASGDASPASATAYAWTEAGDAAQAMAALQHAAQQSQPFDLVLLDIHMPATNGLQLAQWLRRQPQPPAIVFVTAHAEHALTAFELEAVDYLTKPVSLARLQHALARVRRNAAGAAADTESIALQERGGVVRIRLQEVVYFKAELKYVTVRTAARSYVLDGALADLELRYGQRFIRTHRNSLVARHAIRALEKHASAEDAEGWAVRLQGLDELVPVSRRQLPAVREVLLR